MSMNDNNSNSTDYFLFPCPHCGGDVLVFKSEIFCAIFRHGTYKMNGEQIHPHLAKAECERLVAEGLVDGCGLPFRIVNKDMGLAEKCDYI